MARMARAVFAGVPHHITQRGNRKQKVFFNEDDYLRYLSLLDVQCRRFSVEIWAYCLMPNHVHLVAVPDAEHTLAKAIGEAHRKYTCSIHERNNWRGYLWQGRFSSFPMDEEYLLSAVRYVELNPVKARLVSSAEEWRWSSARAHLEDKDDDLVTVDPMRQRVENWKEFLSIFPDSTDKLLRAHENTGRPLGSDVFVGMLEQSCGRALRPRKRGRKVKSDRSN